MVMLPAPILPLAEHAWFGQNCLDVSIGSELVCIGYSMPMDACFFKLSGLFHQLVQLYQLKRLTEREKKSILLMVPLYLLS
jgi:hypothetical protein